MCGCTCMIACDMCNGIQMDCCQIKLQSVFCQHVFEDQIKKTGYQHVKLCPIYDMTYLCHKPSMNLACVNPGQTASRRSSRLQTKVQLNIFTAHSGTPDISADLMKLFMSSKAGPLPMYHRGQESTKN